MDVAAWLRRLGLERYEPIFRDHEIDWEVLPELTESDLEKLGLPLGPRKKLLKAIAALPESAAARNTLGGPVIHGPSSAERRQLTVMFVDMAGSTELSRRLDPEDMSEVMRAYHGRTTEVIRRWGGHVAKYLGDGVLAYFGWPQAHEDDPERAVRAGLGLAQAVAEVDDGAGGRLAVRVGIATGPVVVGELIGEGAAQEQAVVGETPNLAARLQAIASPSEVVIALGTRRLVGLLFELEDLEPQRLKGFAELLAAWRVVGESRAESRFEALHGRHLTPLVGREEELSLLLSRWRRAHEGEGQVVLLSGEPGIGKSRLVRALREHLVDQTYTLLSHNCSPYHTASALYPIIGLLERAAGFRRDDPPDVRLDKLEALLAQGAENVAEAVPLIADVLGIAAGERCPLPNLSPQRKAQRTLELLVEQVEGLASQQPVLALYEDVHWIDPTTLEMLSLLIQRVQRLPVLVLITFRPEFSPPWMGRSHITQLSLSRLTRREGSAMVLRVTSGKALPAEVLQQIVERTDGVPLFVEELTKTVLESGLLRDDADHFVLDGPLPPLAIPATLHDSLMARLDRLAPVKEVAQIGAVIGRDFSRNLLAAVAPLSAEQLDAALDELVKSQLIYRSGATPHADYSFKHALVQDAARRSMLKSKRQQLHARIASVLIEQFATVTDTQPELLAYHFSEAGMFEDAIEYWHRAGERAAQRSANAEALRHLEAALELLASLPEDRMRAERELGLLTLLNPAQMVTKSRAGPEVEKTLERARKVAQELGSLDDLIPATVGLWLLHLVRGALDRARELTQELFELARSGQDDGFMLQAHHAAWTIHLFTGDFDEVRHHMECGLDMYDRERHGNHAFVYIGHDPVACAHAVGAIAYWMLGYTDQALDHITAAVRFAEELEHPPTLVHALNYASNLHVLRGDHRMAATTAERLHSIASELSMAPAMALADGCAGWAMVQRGELDEGFARLERGVDAWRAAGGRIHMPQRLCMLADGLSLTDRRAEAVDANAEAGRVAEATGECWYQAMILCQRGELLRLERDDVEAAEAAFQESLALARAQQARSAELRAATGLARLWAKQGERQQAHDLLAPVYGWFTEGFETLDLIKAKRLLDELA